MDHRRRCGSHVTPRLRDAPSGRHDVSGTGPFDVNYVNAADDPQKKM